MGLSLSGGKQDKACISVMDYYPDQKRFFLSKIFERIKSEGQVSADLRIHEIIEEYKPDIELLGIDSPWKFPSVLSGASLRVRDMRSARNPIFYGWRSTSKL